MVDPSYQKRRFDHPPPNLVTCSPGGHELRPPSSEPSPSNGSLRGHRPFGGQLAERTGLGKGGGRVEGGRGRVEGGRGGRVEGGRGGGEGEGGRGEGGRGVGEGVRGEGGGGGW